MKRHLISRTGHADPAEPCRADGVIGPRPSHRRAQIAAAAVVGLLGGSASSSPGPSAAAPITAVMTDTSSSDDGASPRLSSIHYLSRPTSPLPPSPCRDLISAAARLLSGDPTSWVASLIDGGGQVGQTIDRAIHDRLDMVRTIVMRTNSADPQRTVDLESLDELIAVAAGQPCSSAACSSDEDAAVVDGDAVSSAGWYWLCESPSGSGTD